MLTQAPGSGVANDLGVAFLIVLLYLFFILPFSEIYSFVFASQPHRSIGAATLINIVCVGSTFHTWQGGGTVDDIALAGSCL